MRPLQSGCLALNVCCRQTPGGCLNSPASILAVMGRWAAPDGREIERRKPVAAQRTQQRAMALQLLRQRGRHVACAAGRGAGAPVLGQSVDKPTTHLRSSPSVWGDDCGRARFLSGAIRLMPFSNPVPCTSQRHRALNRALSFKTHSQSSLSAAD